MISWPGSWRSAATSSNFATDIANPDKSAVAGQVVYGAMPGVDGNPGRPNLFNWTIGINSNSAKKDAAFLFLSWATSKPTAALAGAAGLATQRISAWESGAFKERFGAQAVEAVLQNLASADAAGMKALWFHPKGPQLIDAFGIAVNEVVTGSRDAQSALSDAAGKMRAIIG